MELKTTSPSAWVKRADFHRLGLVPIFEHYHLLAAGGDHWLNRDDHPRLELWTLVFRDEVWHLRFLMEVIPYPVATEGFYDAVLATNHLLNGTTNFHNVRSWLSRINRSRKSFVGHRN